MVKKTNSCLKIKINSIQPFLSTLCLDLVAIVISIIGIICCLFDSQQWQGYMTFVIIWSIALGFNLIGLFYYAICPYYLKDYNNELEIKIFRKKYHITREQIISVNHYACNILEAIFYLFIMGGPLNTTIKYRDNLGNIQEIFFICTTKSIKKIFPDVVALKNE